MTRLSALASAAAVAAVLGVNAFAGTTAPPAPAAAPPTATATPEPQKAPAVGEVIPAFEAQSIEGRTQKVDFPKGSKTVLMFFLSGCPHCHKMIPEWNRAYNERKSSLKIYGIMMDKEPPGFFLVMPIEFPVLRSPGRSFLDSIKVFRVPVAVRVGPGGKVEDVAQGEVDRMRVSQIFKP